MRVLPPVERRRPAPGALLLSVLVLLAGAVPAQRSGDAPAGTQAAAPAVNAVFLHWNDFHGQFRPQRAFWKTRPGLPPDAAPLVGGAAALAGFVQRERAAAAALGRTVVVTDGGDWFQGTPEGNETQGLLTVEFFGRLRVDAAVLGNHEYDFGADNVRRLCGAASFPVLGANVVVDGREPRQPVDYVQPFATLEIQGLKVTLLGLVTRETRAVSTGPWGEAVFEAELDALRIVLPAARKAGHVVVLLTHCGVETDRRLAQAFPEIPLILGGHSHTGLAVPLREAQTWIVQTHGKASGIYRLEAHADAAGQRLQLLDGALIELDLQQHAECPETAAWLGEATREIAARWDRVIGRLEAPPHDDRTARSSPLGNLVADLLREAAGADVGLTNKGGLRTRLQAGPLTARQVYELLPFDNDLVSLTLTGAQLRSVLQGALAKGRRPLEIGGGSYRYTEQDGERLLLDVTIGGQPLEDDRAYRIATSSFLARGGDGLLAFTAGTGLQEHGVLLRDVVIRAAERDSVLRADSRNRIEFIARDR